MEALKHAEDIASFAPVSGLKNVLGSLLTLIHDDYHGSHALKVSKLGSCIKSFTGVVLMQFKEESSDVSRQLINDLEEFTRRVRHRVFIFVTDHF